MLEALRLVGARQTALAIGLTAVTVAVLAADLPGSAAQGTLRAQLIGHWRLVSSEQMREGEAPVLSLGPSPAGMISYTADGHMLAHLVSTVRPKVRAADATPDQQRELLRSYPAYFGTFDVDETARTVTHHRDGSQVPGERDFVRTIDLRGNRLVLTTPTTLVEGKKRFARITWERLGVASVVAPHVAAARAAVTGTWELVEHKTTMASGDVRRSFGPSPKGLFVFHEDGHTTVQIVNSDFKPLLLEKDSERFGKSILPFRYKVEGGADPQRLIQLCQLAAPIKPPDTFDIMRQDESKSFTIRPSRPSLGGFDRRF